LLAIFVLLRLWLEALAEADWGLLVLCLAGTSWTIRWMQYTREREQELGRQIASLVNSVDQESDGRITLDRSELRLLSFQAQLALAIMESQRQMMLGGYGHPDGDHPSTPGLSEEGKARWERFVYDAKSGDYGSLAQKEGSEEGPHCSICLGEYENEEQLVKLPCFHVYHDECISSWTSSHTKCPLCNYEMEVTADEIV
jgi:Ring finger domain